MPVATEVLNLGLTFALKESHLDELGERSVGKVRDSYSPGDGRRILITTDRISAFDRVLGTLPFKGQVLNELSAWWFEQTKDEIPNHLQSVPDPNVMICEECEPLPVEFVVRGFLTGVTSTSIWTHYERGDREFCGHRLPDGLRRHERLPEPLLTPSTKAEDGGHDRSVSREELLKAGTISTEDFDEAGAYAMRLFNIGQELCAARGLLLVDTKYEFGRTRDGRIILIDEVHTPDSSRFWYADTYQDRLDAGQNPGSFDKEYVRRWLVENGYNGEGEPPALPDDVRIEASRRYIQACEAVRGEPFVPALGAPIARISEALGLL